MVGAWEKGAAAVDELEGPSGDEPEEAGANVEECVPAPSRPDPESEDGEASDSSDDSSASTLRMGELTPERRERKALEGLEGQVVERHQASRDSFPLPCLESVHG